MNIAFICRTLAIGKCGVGDYTRILAAELIRQGHRVSIIAVRDFCVTDILEELQAYQAAQIPVLRFPMGANLSVLNRRIKSFLDQQGATWLSLQYVPFSFHSKGLHWTWNPFFEKIGQGRHWHIMFHELWLGLNKGAPLKEIWWGEAQRQCLLNLVKKLKPACVHTHAGVYQSVLMQNGIHAKQLPLFSNIYPNPDTTMADPAPNGITFAVFAAIRKSTKQEPFLEELEFENQRGNRSAHIIFLGRNGELKKRWKQAIEKKTSITFEDLGIMDAKAISDHLSKADIGLSFTPLPLTEKSGAVACYWAHGLPVLSLSDAWNPRKNLAIKYPEGAVPYEAGRLQDFLETYSSAPIPYKHPAEIATQFAIQVGGTVSTVI